ncbi:MAG: helix-turn-helix transcriptional regulator [Treponema sp.]|jgi:transcriptional regulator with XRE-family HTH domain|uniref:helix-turn-helix domain-containing protein n=1 Tax=Treponema sp. TaxID=166 RepID=UPI002A916D77|nr:helix-turn-helix transcriptional regulator [Treponema sp.]MDY6398282.1 helix-turn-helix transcriptional regulator [Treponema sp.]
MGEKSEKVSISVLFGQNVKKYRKQAGLTQEQLSEKLGVSQKHLSIIETGAQFASASLIGRISEVLKVSPADLFGGSSDEVLNEIKFMRETIVSMLMNGIMGEFATLDSTMDDIKRLLGKLTSS